MIRDITIGQYYQGSSIIHRLDARTKLIATFLYIVCIFLVKNYVGFVAPVLFLVMVIVLSKVPVKFIFKGLKPVIFIILLTMVFHVFFGSGEAIFSWGIIKITKAGIKRGIFLVLRIILLMLGSSMMTFTTTPGQLTDGLEALFKPLTKLHVPVHEIALMMSIALRFIPVLLEETDKIMKAQQSRGADFETGNVLQRAKSMIPVFIPLIISAFRRAFDLAMAMEARCYNGGNGRTKMHPLRYKPVDFYAAVICVIFTAGTVLLRVYGKGLL